jgi:hypothetical protein
MAWRAGKGANAREFLSIAVAMTEAMRMERHKENGIISVEEAAVVKIPGVMPSISEVGATGGSLPVKGGDEDVAAEWYTIRTAKIAVRATETWVVPWVVTSWKVRKTAWTEVDEKERWDIVGGVKGSSIVVGVTAGMGIVACASCKYASAPKPWSILCAPPAFPRPQSVHARVRPLQLSQHPPAQN